MSENIKDWEPCPRCKSNRIQKNSKLLYFFVFLIMGVILFFVGVVFITFPVIMAISLGFIFGSPLGFLIPVNYFCEDCKYSWRKSKN